MIRKLRWKIVGVSMLLVTTVLLLVFGIFYSATRQNIEEESLRVLQRVLAEGDRAALPDLDGGGVQLPYFSVSVSGGQAVVLSGSYYDLQDRQQLLEIINACLEQQEDVGVLSRYHLRYMRAASLFGQRIAFVDVSVEENTLSNLARSALQVGLLALGLFFAVSLLLAHWAVRPVERALKQQRQFLSDASHELKTPLTVILSNTDLLLESPAAGEEQKRRWLDNVQSESRRMKRLVEEMLTLARADGREVPVERRVLELSELVLDSILLFEPLAFEAGMLLEYDVQQGIVFSGQEDALRQLLAILLDNAIKYAPRHSAIHVRLQEEGRKLRLTVSNPNGGQPIPPEQREQIFDRFYRADDSRGETRGFGLGLAIAATIVQQHRGSIRCESDSESTRFVAEFPKDK